MRTGQDRTGQDRTGQDTIIYTIPGLKRPRATFWQNMLQKLYCNTILHRFSLVKKLYCQAWNIQVSTSISKGFYCSSPLLQVGEKVGLGNTFIVAYVPIIIGDGTSISFNNTIITSTHDYNNFSTVIAKPVIIGKNVWITTNVTILPGVTIGDNTVIGAGSVVTKDIPSGVFAAGNPCKVIKEIDFKK